MLLVLMIERIPDFARVLSNMYLLLREKSDKLWFRKLSESRVWDKVLEDL